jgi:hypothetical protein
MVEKYSSPTIWVPHGILRVFINLLDENVLENTQILVNKPNETPL